MLITKKEIKILDNMYQTWILEGCEYRSLLGCKADLIHHYKHKATSFALRWYIPNGIPLSQEQHNMIHGKQGKELQETIIKIKGKEWLEDLERQKNKLAKYATLDDILEHIMGGADNYV